MVQAALGSSVRRVRGLRHFAQIGRQDTPGDLQVQKARHVVPLRWKTTHFCPARPEPRLRSGWGPYDTALPLPTHRCTGIHRDPGGWKASLCHRAASNPALKCTCQLLGDQIDQKFHACHLRHVIKFHYYSRKVRECTGHPHTVVARSRRHAEPREIWRSAPPGTAWRVRARRGRK